MAYAASTVSSDRELFRAYQIRNQRERRRERDNWRMYDSTEYGQYDDQALRIMIQEGRPPSSFNFIKKNVDTLAGALLMDPFELSFDTELGDDATLATMLNEMYLEDRELGMFANEYLLMLRAGFIYRGWLEMFKDYSRDPRGRVGIRYVPPDRIVTDPDWASANVKDNKCLFMWAWMTAQQIKDKYGNKLPELSSQIAMFETYRAATNDYPDGEKLFDTSPEFWDQQNGLFLVIDKHELCQEAKTRIFDADSGIFMRDMEADDADIFHETATLLGKNLEKVKQTEQVQYVSTFCPALNMSKHLQRGKHSLQLGKYSFFAFSSDSINGRPNTPVDILRDAQTTFNKRQASITHILMTTSNNALLIEDDVASPTTIERIGKERNRPGAYFVVQPGGAASGKIRNMDKGQPPNNFMDSANNIWDLGEKLTPAVPATQGIAGGQDSGVLYQAKVAQAQIGMQIPQKFLKATFSQLGDAYFFAARQTYTYPIQFVASRSKNKYALNLPGGFQMEDMVRLRVTVTQSPSSESYRRQLLQQYIAIAQYLPDPLTRQALSRLVIKSLPNVPQEELDVLDEVAKLSEDLQKKNTELQIATIDQQLSQIAAPPPPEGSPGMSAESPEAGLGMPEGSLAAAGGSQAAQGQGRGPSMPPAQPRGMP